MKNERHEFNGWVVKRTATGSWNVIDPLSEARFEGKGVRARFLTLSEAKTYCYSNNSPNE